MKRKYFVDANGNSLMIFVPVIDDDGETVYPEPIEGMIEVPEPTGFPNLNCVFDFTYSQWIEKPAEPIVLKSVTKRQLRLTLIREKISLASVEALISAMPEGQAKDEAQIEWEDTQEFSRNHPTLLLVAEALNLSPAKVDEMWLKAMVA